LLREHIQHFDIRHLKILGSIYGFEIVDFFQTANPSMSEKMIFPNLCVIFKLNKKIKKISKTKKSSFLLKKNIIQYVKYEKNKLKDKKNKIKDNISFKTPVYVWGIGREFFYLYENSNIKQCNIIGLIDSNTYKRDFLTVNGKKIINPLILESASFDSILIISAIAHIEEIKNNVRIIDFKGKIMEF
jgi:hypothetical protein